MSQRQNGWPSGQIRDRRMYAISFVLDTEFIGMPPYGYDEICRILEKHGFGRRQGSIYFGDDDVTPVSCVIAVQAIQRECHWFAKSLRDIRMLRIEESNNLMPAIDLFSEHQDPSAAK